MHKYSIGQLVYFEGPFQYDAARGQYKIVSLVPIEKGNKVVYRIKNRRKHSNAPPRNTS
jgi:hypothetical protein